MAKRIEFKSQNELPVAADSDKNAVRKQEYDSHVANNVRHLPPGGQVGQVLVMTASGLAWKYPKIACSCGTGSITFQESVQGAQLQGIDFNAIREVEIL
jgi:hypothetical protein